MEATSTTEPIAWWLVGGFITVILIVLGFVLKTLYKSILQAIKELNDTLNKILQTLASQSEKNEIYKANIDELWKKHDDNARVFESWKDKVIELENHAKYCPNNTFKS